MPGGKPVQTREQQSLRVRAFEGYLQGHQNQGRKPSFRAIAMALGVTENAVRYWCTKDKWDVKVDALLNEKLVSAAKGTKAVANLLRSNLYENLTVLNRIIRDDVEKPLIRIRAISEFADICIKLKVIEPGDLDQKPTAALSGFKDDVDANSGTRASGGIGPGRIWGPGTGPTATTDGNVLSDNHDNAESGSVDSIPSPAISDDSAIPIDGGSSGYVEPTIRDGNGAEFTEYNGARITNGADEPGSSEST